MKLTLTPDMTLYDGPFHGQGGIVFRFGVLGLIHPEEARIYNKGNDRNPCWEIIRIHGQNWADPTGNYTTADEALAALQTEVDQNGGYLQKDPHGQSVGR